MSELDADITSDETETSAPPDTSDDGQPVVTPDSSPPTEPPSSIEADGIAGAELETADETDALASDAPPAEPTPDASAAAAAIAVAEAETPDAATVPAEPQPAPEPEPEPAAGPRTVGRFIADALRTAGVRYAFTVP